MATLLRFPQAAKPAIDKATDKLKDIALALIDELEKGVLGDLNKHREAVAKSPLASVGADNGAADRAVEGSQNWLNDLRSRVESEHAALAVIAELGLIDDI